MHSGRRSVGKIVLFFPDRSDAMFGADQNRRAIIRA